MYKFIPDCREESKFVQSTSWFQSGKKTKKSRFDCVHILRAHPLSSDLDFNRHCVCEMFAHLRYCALRFFQLIDINILQQEIDLQEFQIQKDLTDPKI